jgi:phosphatidylinositol alpha-mannosyltransferase
MKIGIISDICAPYPSGVAQYVYQVYTGLKNLGVEAKIITSGYRERIEDEGIIRIGKTFLFPYNGNYVTLTVGRGLSSQLKKILREENFDLLYINGPLGPVLPLLSLIHSSCINVGVFHAYHNRNLAYALSRPGLRRYYQKLKGKIAVSEAAREAISHYYPDHYEIIPCGVDTQQFHPGNPRLPQYDDGIFNILFLGRLEPRKGLSYLLKAFTRIKQEISETRLIVVGSGPNKKKYQTMIPAPIKGDVHFVGKVCRELLSSYYATADIFVSPATGQESLGIVLLEAMASGKPVVASDIPGYRTVITRPEEGILVEPRNSEKLARTIIELLKSPEKRKILATGARKRAETYSWDNINRKILNYCQHILSPTSTY